MPSPPRSCQRCDQLLLPGDSFVVVEVSAIHRFSPQCRRWLLCADCGANVSNWLTLRPELAGLGTLTTVTR